MKYKHFKQALLFKVGADLNCRKFAPTRPEGAEAPSPGQSPWVVWGGNLSPCKGKSFKTPDNL